MALGINSPATGDKETLGTTRGVFNRPPGLGVTQSTCEWKLGGLSTGIVLPYLPWSHTFSLSVPYWPSLRIGWLDPSGVRPDLSSEPAQGGRRPASLGPIASW